MIAVSMLLASALAAAPAASNLDCDEARTDSEINECAHRAVDKAEAKLNQTYKKVLASLNGDKDALAAKQQLVEAQREWVRFRELDCKGKQTLSQGGTISTVVYFSCMQDHAELRTKQLESWADF